MKTVIFFFFRVPVLLIQVVLNVFLFCYILLSVVYFLAAIGTGFLLYSVYRFFSKLSRFTSDLSDYLRPDVHLHPDNETSGGKNALFLISLLQAADRINTEKTQKNTEFTQKNTEFTQN